MKNKIYLAIILVAIFVTAMFLFDLPSKVEALGTSIVQNDGNIYTSTSTGVTYLTANSASSTVYATVDGTSKFGVDICATGSSSASILSYKVFYTPQDLTPMASTTWYQETTNNLYGSTTAAAYHIPVIHYVPLATTTIGTNYVCVNIAGEPINGKNMKIQMSTLGANASVWRMVTSEVDN